MARRRTVVFGLLGTTLDSGSDPYRWKRWRPSVALCQFEDLLVDRFEFLYSQRWQENMETIREDLSWSSPETTLCPHLIHFEDPWDFERVYEALHEFTKGYPFDPEREDYLIHITTGTHVAQICLFLLTEARYFPGRLLQTSPPPRGVQSSPGSYRVIDLDLSRYDRIATRFYQETDESVSFLKFGIHTRSERFNRLIEQIERVAIASRAPILLTGPTGAGKTRLARRIYELKRARHQIQGRFVEVNCATLRGEQAMAALFGHLRGAFTGAQRDRPGLLKTADGGVLFLDEIGELGLDEQAMLLRALESRTFLPVGADDEHQSDFQLIAGTNQSLRQGVARGRFREDLLARINLWTFSLPGLVERREDIAPNLDYELERFAETEGRQVRFNQEARRRFLDFALSPRATWRGNFRDLNAAVVRMSTLSPAGRITSEAVDEERDRLRDAWAPAEEASARATSQTLLARFFSDEQLTEIDLFDQLQLAQVLELCLECQTLSEAGRRLYNASRARRRSTNDADRIRKYLARFGLTWQRFTEP